MSLRKLTPYILSTAVLLVAAFCGAYVNNQFLSVSPIPVRPLLFFDYMPSLAVLLALLAVLSIESIRRGWNAFRFATLISYLVVEGLILSTSFSRGVY